MTRARRSAGSWGFTLIEVIAVLAVVSIAAATIVSLQGSLFRGQSDNKDIVVGTQLMQECAEQLLSIRRRSSVAYNTVTNTACATLGNFGGFGAPSVTLTVDGGSSPVSTCTSASTTCTATITISKSLGQNLAPITLQLYNY